MITFEQIREQVEKVGMTFELEGYTHLAARLADYFVRGAQFKEYQTISIVPSGDKVNFFGCPQGFRGNPMECWPIHTLQNVELADIPNVLNKLRV